jgi:hypothetical protein
VPGRRLSNLTTAALFKIVLTGFNTDIEYQGVVYHVQTEDKGLESPLILSLVYAGGAILASKRTRYEDLIASGFDEEVLAKRLKRQHSLICAAINAGRLEELKRMSGRIEEEVIPAPVSQATLPVTEPLEAQPSGEPAAMSPAAEAETRDEDSTLEVPRPVDETADAEVGVYSKKSKSRRRPSAKEPVYTIHDPRAQESPLGEAPDRDTPLVLTLLDEHEFQAGQSFVIRVRVEDGTGSKQKPLNGVSISVKILGTTFRPQIYSVRTERDGVAAVSTTMPNFTSGRAAVLIRAVANGETTELRRVIHPSH